MEIAIATIVSALIMAAGQVWAAVISKPKKTRRKKRWGWLKTFVVFVFLAVIVYVVRLFWPLILMVL